MTTTTASQKLIAATQELTNAIAARNAMALVVAQEQAGFDRMIPVEHAVRQAKSAEDWASSLLVKAISQDVR